MSQYENDETITTRIHQHRSVRGFVIWLATIAGIIVIGIAAYGVYLVRSYIPYVGEIWLFTVAILPMIAVCFLITALVKYILKAEIIEIGTQGNAIRFLGKVTMLHPLGIQEYRNHGTKEQKNEGAETPHVPDLLNVLKDGLLSGVDLLLGYHVDGTPRFGTWDDLRTFVVAGKSRSGKTVTMVFFIVQALLAHATVYVCDPHYSKKTGLLKVIEPLLPYLKIARTDGEIIEAVKDFSDEMKARVNQSSTIPDVPMLLVIDEWSKLLRDLDNVEIELLVNTVLGCAEEYAGYNGYAMIAGHEWTARESGGKKGAAIRRAFHSVFVHRLDEDYAKFLLTGKNKRMAKTAPNLPTGNAHFQDSEGELDYLIIPYYGKQKEGIYEVIDMLNTIEGTTETPQLTTSHPASSVNALTVSPDALRLMIEQMVTHSPSAYINTPDEVPTVNDGDVQGDMDEVTKVEYIKRLRKRGVPHRHIAYMLHLDGAKYKQYQALCEAYDIPLKEETVKQETVK